MDTKVPESPEFNWSQIIQLRDNIPAPQQPQNLWEIPYPDNWIPQLDENVLLVGLSEDNSGYFLENDPEGQTAVRENLGQICQIIRLWGDGDISIKIPRCHKFAVITVDQRATRPSH